MKAQDSLGISTENLEVVKRFEASILQAEKKELEIEVAQKEVSPLVFRYDLNTEKIVDFDKPEPEVRALGYKHEDVKKPEVKNGYVYGGYGTHATLTAGGAYHYYIEDWMEAGFKVDHFGAAGEQESVDLNYRRTKADVYTGYYLNPNTKIKLKGFGDLRRHDWTDLESSILTIPYDLYGGKVSFHYTSFEDLGLSVRLDPTYTVATGFEPLKENILSLPVNVLKSFSDNISIELPFRYDINSIDILDSVSISENDLVLQPFIRYKNGNISAKAGVNYFQADESTDVFPNISIKAKDLVENLEVNLWVSSSYERMTLTTLGDRFTYFPAITQVWSSSNGYFKNFDKTYGLNGLYNLDKFQFSLGAEYAQIIDGPNPYLNFSLMDLEFLNWNEIRITPAVKYLFSEDVDVELSALYRSFSLDTDIELSELYLPELEINLVGKQRLLSDKLTLEERLTYNSSRRMLELGFPIANTINEVHGFVDLSLSVQYNISPTIGIYLNGTNLLGSEYQVWFPIDAFRQQVWGGLKLRI